jgi:hypothetical protein
VSVRLDPDDFGRTISIGLRGLAGNVSVCTSSCSVVVPARVSCPVSFNCEFNAATRSIDATWDQPAGLDSQRLLKDGVLVVTLPAGATSATVLLQAADFGRAVLLALEGFSGGTRRCLNQCVADVPPRVVCPGNFTCSVDLHRQLLLASWSQAAGLEELLLFKDGILQASLPPGEIAALVPLLPGDFGREVFLSLHGQRGGQVVCQASCLVTVPAQEPFFVRGDTNADGQVDVGDFIFLENVLQGFAVPPCEKSCDLSDDGQIFFDDRSFLFQYLNGGPEPLPPFPFCGPDPTSDPLTCENFPPCT